MKRFFVILLSLFILTFVLAIPSFADSSVTLTGFDNIISWTLHNDEDDPIEYLDLEFQTYGGTGWSRIERIQGYDLNSVNSYTIPASLYLYGNEFRVVAVTSLATRYSSVYTVTKPYFDNYSLSYDYDSGVFYFPFSPSNTVLHFDYQDSSSNPDFIQAPITISSGKGSYSYVYGIQSVVFPNGNTQTYVSVPLHDCLVYATTVVRGVTYTSNTVLLFGSSATVTPPVDTDVYHPLVTDVDNMVEIIYSGVMHTPVYRYTMSAVLLCLPVIAGAFVVKKFVL